MEFSEFVETRVPPNRQPEARRLDEIFKQATGWAPVIWPRGMVGYGAYDYQYASGRRGTWFATGFAVRKAKLSIYILPGYTDFSEILARLGKHTKGKSCVYLTKLADADESVLGALIAAGVRDLATHWPVKPAPLDNTRGL